MINTIIKFKGGTQFYLSDGKIYCETGTTTGTEGCQTLGWLTFVGFNGTTILSAELLSESEKQIETWRG
jgi:hypothetical protein